MPTAAKHDSKNNQVESNRQTGGSSLEDARVNAPNDVVFFGKLPGPHNIVARLCPVRVSGPRPFHNWATIEGKAALRGLINVRAHCRWRLSAAVEPTNVAEWHITDVRRCPLFSRYRG
jgi:hypothetical protein